MKVINLGVNNSVLNNYVAAMRDKKAQKDPMKFRYNLERVGAIFAYEISRTLDYSVKEVVTPLGIASVPTTDSEVVLAAILRAALPLHQGMLKVFENAPCAFVSAYRKYDRNDGGYNINMEYCTAPSIEGRVLVIMDAMLATGVSVELALDKLLEKGNPAHIHIVSPLASLDAVNHLKKKYMGEDVTLWVAAIDEELTTRGLIIPGLGDAGDLAFGSKA